METARTQKLCSRLWNGMVIRYDGNVYPCCNVGHREPFRLGNINTNTMDEIVNSDRVKNLRQLSIESRLPCYEGCDQVKLFEAHPIQNPESVMSKIEDYRDLQVEYGEVCNVDCIMCWQDRDNLQTLKYEVLKEKLPLENWGSINALGGEVFIIPDANKHIQDILGLGNHVLTVTTNGMTLGSHKIRELLVKNAREVIISVNAAHEAYHTHVMRPKEPFFDLVIKNSQKLQEMKQTLNPNFRINGHFTAVIETIFEIPYYLRRFKEWGFDKAIVNFDHRDFPHFFKENPGVTKKLSELISKEIKTSNYKHDITICMTDHLSLKLD